MTWFADQIAEYISPAGGFDPSMRRSIQTAVLFEANRCLADKLPTLRPFQRKIALLDTANYLVETLNLPAKTKEEILYRTATSKEPLNTETAWKRMKLIEREVEKVIDKIRPLLANHSPEQALEVFIQNQYETVTGAPKGKAHPCFWEHTHNNVILTYRIFYRGDALDPNLPPARPPKQIVVPAEKPKAGGKATAPSAAAAAGSSYFLTVGGESDVAAATAKVGGAGEDSMNDVDLEAIVNGEEGSGENRRLVLKEVRDHLELLKEFEGIISPEELNKRKRDLFMALPSAPPPASGRKKLRTSDLVEPTHEV